jgi:DNA-directed RNA polymerase subunit beta
MERIEGLRKAGFSTVRTFLIAHSDEADILRNTLKKDSTKTEDEALTRIYNLLRPGEPPRADTARDILKKLFFNPKRYDLAKVGRYKLNRKLPHDIILGGKDRRKKLALEVPDDNQTTLGPEDFLVIVAYLMHLRLGSEMPGLVVSTDDIDHLGNRRVRAVGELLANQFNVGLARMARIIRERMTLQDAGSGHAVRPHQRATISP